MKHPTGQYHKHAAFWTYYPSTRIAGLLSGQKMTIGAFTRPTFSARALIHKDANGNIYYDRVYSDNQENRQELIKQLESIGIKSIGFCSRNVKFNGYVKTTLCIGTPYMDSMVAKKIKDSNGNIVYTISR